MFAFRHALLLIFLLSCSITQHTTSSRQTVVLPIDGNCDYTLKMILDFVKSETGLIIDPMAVSYAYCWAESRSFMWPNEFVVKTDVLELFISQGRAIAASGADSYLDVCVRTNNDELRKAAISAACQIQSSKFRTSCQGKENFVIDNVTSAVSVGALHGPQKGFCSYEGRKPFEPARIVPSGA